jgi:hypothetical protein
MKHLESFRFVLFHKVRALEDERDPLEEQVERLKSNVGDMYDEFVREFRQKQNFIQDFATSKNLSSALQKENVKLRAMLTQLKKDGKRLLNDMEQVLHPDTSEAYESLPKLMAEVCEKNKHLNQWAPPEEDEETGGKEAADPFAEAGKEAAIIEEMATQRDLLFRKNQIAVSAAAQSKRECAQDVRRLTSENAALITEMNTLRNEQKSWKRSYKELEARMMAMEANETAKARVAGKAGGNETVLRNSSAPALNSSDKGPSPGSTQKPRSRGSAGGGAVADTPYVRRKVVDQQEVYRRQKVKGANQLPPVSQAFGMGAAADPRMQQTSQEKRFTQSLEQGHAGKRHMERQGFDVGNLSREAEAIASHLPLQASRGPVDTEMTDVPESFPAAEEIQG